MESGIRGSFEVGGRNRKRKLLVEEKNRTGRIGAVGREAIQLYLVFFTLSHILPLPLYGVNDSLHPQSLTHTVQTMVDQIGSIHCPLIGPLRLSSFMDPSPVFSRLHLHTAGTRKTTEERKRQPLAFRPSGWPTAPLIEYRC